MDKRSSIPFNLKVRALVCGMIVNLMFGAFYAFSNTYIYVSNYLRQFDSSIDEQGKHVMIAMPLWLFFQCLFTIVSVRIADCIGWWALNYIAFAWFSLNNLAMVYIKNYYAFLLVYGVSNGMAFGLGYLPALYISWTYFPERKSLATGSLLFSTAMATFILSPLATMIVNPDNLPDEHPAVIERVPLLFKCLTAGFLVMTLVACSLQPSPYIQETPEDSDQDKNKHTQQATTPVSDTGRIRNLGVLLSLTRKGVTRDEIIKIGEVKMAEEGGAAHQETFMMMGQLHEKQIQELALNETLDEEKVTDIETKQQDAKTRLDQDTEEELGRLGRVAAESSCPSVLVGIQSVSFLLLALMVLSNCTFCYMMLTTWKSNFKKHLGMKDRELAYLLSFGAIANALGRLLTGLLLLKLPFKAIYIPMVLVVAGCAFSIDHVLTVSMNQRLAIAYLGVAFFGLGTSVTVFPTVCMKVFGIRVGSRIYPFIYICFSLACGLSYAISRVSKDLRTMFFTLGGMATFGLILSLFFKEKPAWKPDPDRDVAKSSIELK